MTTMPKPIVRVPSLVTTLLVHSSKIRSIYGDAFVRLFGNRAVHAQC